MVPSTSKRVALILSLSGDLAGYVSRLLPGMQGSQTHSFPVSSIVYEKTVMLKGRDELFVNFYSVESHRWNQWPSTADAPTSRCWIFHYRLVMAH